MRNSLRLSWRIYRLVGVGMIAMALAATLPAKVAQAQTGPDYAIAWSGALAARSLKVPTLAAGPSSFVVGSFRLWIPSGGTWHVESAVATTGVRKATAPGSRYGRVSVGHTLECGPDLRDSTGRLTTRAATIVTGRNMLYDETRTTTARNLWTTASGYNRCQVVITLAPIDAAVAGKLITLESGSVRLVGRGLDNPRSTLAYGQPQTMTLPLPAVRFLSAATPTITSPNFQISSYVAPEKLAVAGDIGISSDVTYLDAIGDGYITTCYTTSVSFHLPACPSFNGTVLTGATYRTSLIVQQFQADGTVCRQTASPSLIQTTPSLVHHQETRNRVSVPIDAACSSRNFRAKLYIRWVSGNTFFFEAGALSHISIRPASS
jgi:hypothetical protein